MRLLCILFITLKSGYDIKLHFSLNCKKNNVKKAKIKSYSKFEKEIRNLIDFYKMNSVYLERTEDKDFWKEDLIVLKSQEIDSQLEVKIPERKRRVLQYRKHLIFILRELIYVRLISALEVFLIDSVKDVFLVTKTPFQPIDAIKNDENNKNDKYPLTKSQLLSFSSISDVRNEILKKETRKLSSKGFKDIIKYYKRFNINLGEFEPGKEKMIKYHQIRHILVHRLGKVDKKFKLDYEDAEDTISLSEKDLISAINDITKFCISTKKALNNYLKNELVNQSITINAGSIYYIRCSLKSKVASPDFVSPEFEFLYKGELKAFKDIRYNVNYSTNKFHIELRGELGLLNAYMSELRRNAGRGGHGKLKVEKKTDWDSYIQSKNQQDKPISEEKRHETIEEWKLIVKVKELLPEQPWGKGIHKEIAKQLNIPNGRVSKAIKKLIKEGYFKDQINGEVIEDEA